MKTPILILLATALAACSGNVYSGRLASQNTATVNTGNHFTCAVSNVSVSGSNVTMTITAGGGAANYTLNTVVLDGIAGTLVGGSRTFASSSTDVLNFLSLNIANGSSASGSVNITDNAGTSTTCAFSASGGSAAASNALACSVVVSNSAPTVGQTETIVFNASGGTAPYHFAGFAAGATTSSQNVTIATAAATATVVYAAAGAATTTMQLTDDANGSVTCSSTLEVQAPAQSTNNPTVAITNIGTGFFMVQGGLYNSPSTNHYCQIMSAEQWAAMGAPANPNGYDQIPPGMVNDGQCPIPAGFFVFAGGLFRAFNNAHFCQFTSGALWNALGGANGYSTYPVLPNSMVQDAQCALPAGDFRIGGGGYYADAANNYCSFVNLPQVYNSGAGEFYNLPDYSPLPNSMHYTGNCGWSTGTPIYRLHFTTNVLFDFLFSLSNSEGVPYYTLDGWAFTLLGNGNTPGAVMMYRCHWINGQHLLTTAANCEGWIMDGPIGYVLSYPATGSTMLYRLYYPPTGERFSSKDPGEIQNAAAYGWVVEGPQGYVF